MIVQHPSLPFKVNTDTGEVWVPKRHGMEEGWTCGSLESKGYRTFNYHGKKYKVHRVVAETCIPNPENYPFVDHINRVRDDNRPCNLRWATRSMNARNSIMVDRAAERMGFRRYEDPEKYKKLYQKSYYENNRERLLKYAHDHKYGDAGCGNKLNVN